MPSQVTEHRVPFDVYVGLEFKGRPVEGSISVGTRLVAPVEVSGDAFAGRMVATVRGLCWRRASDADTTPDWTPEGSGWEDWFCLDPSVDLEVTVTWACPEYPKDPWHPG